MNDRRKIKLVQALTGAVVLTILMQGMTLLGMPQYTWMLFLPLLMFFALGADFKNIPSMVICYAVGELWCVVNSLVTAGFTSAFGPTNMVMSNILPTIIVPCIFMGMATSFFTLFMQQPIGYFHLFGFWCYGIVLAVCLVGGGMLVCGAIFGKERAMAAMMPPQAGEKNAQ